MRDPVRTNVTLRLTPCRSRDKPELLLARLDAGGRDGAVVVRVRDEKAAEAAADLLRKRGREARTLTPGMNRDAVARTSAWFSSAGRPGLAVVEGVTPPARGDVRQVFVMNLPPSLDAAAADLDLAGADGLTATADYFASARDIDARLSPPLDAGKRERALESIAWMENDGCARRFLFQALSDRKAANCGNCGWCLGQVARFIPWERRGR